MSGKQISLPSAFSLQRNIDGRASAHDYKIMGWRFFVRSNEPSAINCRVTIRLDTLLISEKERGNDFGLRSI